MRPMHAVDINCTVRELQSIVGSRVDKVFQDRPGLIRIRFYGGPSGRAELLIEAGKRIHLTEYKRKAPQLPTSFAMFLRKHLGNLPLSAVSQHDFDRIVLLRFGEMTLIAEIFSQGNVVLLDGHSEVMLSMRKGPEDRISKGKAYVFPQPPLSPFEIADARALRLGLQHRDLVRSLAVDLGLGKLYAEELCAATGLPKETRPSELSDQQALVVIEWVGRMKKAISGLAEAVVYGGTEPTEFSPFPLESMRHETPSTARSFNEAADRYYAHGEAEQAREQASSLWDDAARKLAQRLEIQTAQLEQLRSKARELRGTGDLIYSDFSTISPLIDQLRQEAKVSQQIIVELLTKGGMPGRFAGFDPASRILTLRIGSVDVPLDLHNSLGENAAKFYEKAKDLERRAEGAARAIAETRTKLDSSRAKGIEVAPALQLRPNKPEWFEKFRWFFSSDGNLVIAGRDVRSNETLVRRYLEDHDTYVHSDIQGAPSIVVKPEDGQIGPKAIRDACIFALIHSKAWKSGTTSGDVYWVTGDQVTKRPTSGEYVARGSFVIRGKRNYVRGIEARCGIGWLGNRFMCGPLEAVRHRCSTTLEIAPGERRKSDLAKEVARRLAPKDVRPDLDQVIQILPAGRLSIVEPR